MTAAAEREVVTMRVLAEVLDERKRQDERWGRQDHPSVPSGLTEQQVCELLEIPSEGRARLLCETAFRRGAGTYAHIAIEELSEIVSAAAFSKDGDAAARKELVQLAAVCVQWIEAIDRRATGGGT